MLIEQQKDFKYLIVLLTGCTPNFSGACFYFVTWSQTIINFFVKLTLNKGRCC